MKLTCKKDIKVKTSPLKKKWLSYKAKKSKLKKNKKY